MCQQLSAIQVRVLGFLLAFEVAHQSTVGCWIFQVLKRSWDNRAAVPESESVVEEPQVEPFSEQDNNGQDNNQRDNQPDYKSTRSPCQLGRGFCLSAGSSASS
ncbi:hypothetical protein PHYSODRAFT_307990 [Phytophthora sojae]|uniref:Uncharacterized protein n=1 Tax=Phytophthora sojae (strain P6497) TaxID=1094619 RepID=G5AHL3_PHYSP|nr:hypothetical protein PHYSODRAFT_307990 [Phytophthora sojae]EGZ04934.1 hypothetical protein PHYSODRAFT_307990 [Phytophthora sojae]|eukprot:XP_009539564.1 hypothetical protein PHYSODRAFT_307990 [Phytophthora sojae]